MTIQLEQSRHEKIYDIYIYIYIYMHTILSTINILIIIKKYKL
jgi:hypothetical protein